MGDLLIFYLVKIYQIDQTFTLEYLQKIFVKVILFWSSYLWLVFLVNAFLKATLVADQVPK